MPSAARTLPPLLVLLLAGCGAPAKASPPGEDARPAAVEAVASWPDVDETLFLGNARCPKSGSPVRVEDYFEHEGERAYFCNPDCAAEGGRDPERWLAIVYPETLDLANSRCPVTGAELAAGTGSVVRFQGRLVHVRDEDAVGRFWDDPRLYTRRAVAVSR